MITRKCSQCGKSFTLSDSEINFYNSKGLNLPKRCKECREQNKITSNNTSYKKEYNNSIIKFVTPLVAVIIIIIFAFIPNLLDNSNIQNTIIPDTFQSTDSSVQFETTITIENSSNYSSTIAENNSTSFTETELTTESLNKGYTFRNNDLLMEHFQKHGADMGFTTPEDYEKAAGKVVNSELAIHKKEKEDNDDIYYIEDTNEFVVVSKDGFIRTYFYPDDGKNYFDRQ